MTAHFLGPRLSPLASLALVGLLAPSAGCRRSAAPVVSGSVAEALRLHREGDAKPALAMLEGIVAADPSGRTGDEAALVLGNLLISAQRNSEALAPLARAEKGKVAPEYAALLLVRATVEGGLQDRYADAEARALGFERGDRAASPFVREEARYLLARLFSTQKQWLEAAETATRFVQESPKSQHLDEVRWLEAEALRNLTRHADAHDAYGRIWYESPSSPWAKQARQALRDLESSQRLLARELRADERYKFIQALRKAGLHPEALDEINTYLSQAGATQRDGALFLRSASLYSLRKNDECVRTAEQLRRSYPKSPHVPAAAVQAIRALRRSESTAAVKEWAEWVERAYPGHPKASEALYNLGVYLQNTVSEQEGIAVLERLVSEAPRADDGDDALWKIAWSQRRTGGTQEAVGTLRRLMDNYPDSGYRKSALYWVARLTADQDRGQAVDFYQTLLREFPHDYYGHQAAASLAALGVPPAQIGNGQTLPPVDRLERPDARPDEAYQLAANLKRTGLYEFAAQELLRVPGIESDRTLQFALADLHSLSGNTWAAHAILRKHFKDFMEAGSRDQRLVPMDFWYACYPYNYREIIRKAVLEAGLDKSGINPTLVASLIRMESRFQATATSPVGAVGLMQLMPETAAAIAREMGAAPPTRSDLFSPETNIRYGVRFLKRRVADFGGDWFPSICSYNAGVEPVRQWWGKKPVDQPQDEFIENIPYVDTRLYIKQILGDYQNYRWIYKQGS